jgi:hypothetical protein
MNKIRLIIDLSQEECFWLERDLKAGEEFFVYKGCTYRCISKNGIAVTEREDCPPFFEIPLSAIERIY